MCASSTCSGVYLVLPRFEVLKARSRRRTLPSREGRITVPSMSAEQRLRSERKVFATRTSKTECLRNGLVPPPEVEGTLGCSSHGNTETAVLGKPEQTRSRDQVRSVHAGFPYAYPPACRSSDLRLAKNRWVNLWPPQSFAEGFTPTGASGDEGSSSGGELEADQQDDVADRDVSAGLTSDISSTVFMGNFVLFVTILTGIFVVHIALAAGVEAYWITKVRLV